MAKQQLSIPASDARADEDSILIGGVEFVIDWVEQRNTRPAGPHVHLQVRGHAGLEPSHLNVPSGEQILVLRRDLNQTERVARAMAGRSWNSTQYGQRRELLAQAERAVAHLTAETDEWVRQQAPLGILVAKPAVPAFGEDEAKYGGTVVDVEEDAQP